MVEQAALFHIELHKTNVFEALREKLRVCLMTYGIRSLLLERKNHGPLRCGAIPIVGPQGTCLFTYERGEQVDPGHVGEAVHFRLTKFTKFR